jgi:uncharacterized protein YpmB
MKVLGTATELATATTKFTTATSVYVFNTDSSAAVVTVRNADDDGNVGTIYIAAGAGAVIDLEIGQGLRAANTVYGTHIASGD